MFKKEVKIETPKVKKQLNWILKIKYSIITDEEKKRTFTDSVVVQAPTMQEAVDKYYKDDIKNSVVIEVKKLQFKKGE